jgi:glycosyltransferase involved in cell wall biosynthesis
MPTAMPERDAAPRPLVSIVTVVRNGGALIGPTIESVLRLKSAEVEYVVHDGVSTDGTQAVIAGYDGIDVWQSVADTGIYDAMNIGARRASGSFVYFLNAGDILLALPLAELRAAAADTRLLAFPVLVDGVHVFRPSAGYKLKLTNTLHHQGNFYRRGDVPDYDLRYRVYADYDLNLRLAQSGKIVCHDGPVIAMHMTDGVSNRRESATELFALVRKWQGRSGVAASWCYFKLRGALWRLNFRI